MDLVPEEAMRAACDAYDAAERGELRDDAPMEEHAEVKAVLAAAPLILAAEYDRMIKALGKLWPDPMGQFSAEQAHAARVMKQSLIEALGRRASVLRGEGDRT